MAKAASTAHDLCMCLLSSVQCISGTLFQKPVQKDNDVRPDIRRLPASSLPIKHKHPPTGPAATHFKFKLTEVPRVNSFFTLLSILISINFTQLHNIYSGMPGERLPI